MPETPRFVSAKITRYGSDYRVVVFANGEFKPAVWFRSEAEARDYQRRIKIAA